MIPICWLRSYKYLSLVNLFSNLILIASMGVIMKYCIQNHYENPEISNDLRYFYPSGFPLFFGVAVAIMEGNGIILNIQSTMKKPQDFNMMLIITIGFFVLLVVTFGSIGYWAYGNTINELIPLNLPHDDVTDFTQILFCFGLFSSIALQSMPIYEIYEKSNFYKELPTLKAYP